MMLLGSCKNWSKGKCSLNPKSEKPSLLVKRDKEKSLSGKELAKLLAAVLEKGAPFRFTARGFSMSPIIKDGDIITVHPIHTKNMRVGDIVAILQPNTEKLVVHRFIRKKDNLIIAMGDNNSDYDEAVPQQQLLGKVKVIERHGAKIRFGLGIERFLIAWIMRRKLFLPLILKSKRVANALVFKTKLQF